MHRLRLARMKAQKDGTTILVARRCQSLRHTHAPLGFLILRTVEEDEAEVITIAVHPRQRGRGVGKKLMEAGLFRLYGERSLQPPVSWKSMPQTKPQLLLYRGLGFKEVGEEKRLLRCQRAVTVRRLSCASIFAKRCRQATLNVKQRGGTFDDRRAATNADRDCAWQRACA